MTCAVSVIDLTHPHTLTHPPPHMHPLSPSHSHSLTHPHTLPPSHPPQVKQLEAEHRSKVDGLKAQQERDHTHSDHAHSELVKLRSQLAAREVSWSHDPSTVSHDPNAVSCDYPPTQSLSFSFFSLSAFQNPTSPKLCKFVRKSPSQEEQNGASFSFIAPSSEE